MEFLVDTHVHTSEASSCGELPGADMIALYAANGYQAAVVTDHYWDGFFAPFRDRPWHEQVDRYLTGYRNACAAGARLGVAVFFGIELRLCGCNNDYLVLGISEEVIRQHPRLYQLSLFDAFDLFDRLGALLIHAHPFRPCMTPVDPRLLHGMEVVNGHPNHRSNNPRALEYARANRLRMTGGSDAHFAAGACRGGMVFSRALRDSRDLADAVRAGDYLEIRGPDDLRIPPPGR